MDTAGAQPHVVIVGGGIAGLAAAFFLRDEAVRVTVLEGSPRLGGKLSVSEVAGVSVDEGAEALLVTRPEGIALIADVGLADQRVVPGTTSSAIWTLGALRPLPRRQFMGVPTEMAELAESGVLTDGGVARARQDLELPPTARDGDVPVARYVGARLGHEVVDRLVDPLLGGVYAGRSAELSFDATLPALAAASRRYPSLTEAARSLLPPPPPAGQPASGSRVFTTLAGGLGVLPGYLAKASGATIRTGAMARDLASAGNGWRLTVGSAADPERVDADAVILAVPARPAGRLLAAVAGASAAVTALGEISYASMAIVTLAYPRSAFPEPGLRARGWSGYLVPAVDGRAVKAVTFSTVKWPHLADVMATDGPLEIVRCSVGRIGEQALLQREDGELAEVAAAELATATGARGGPVTARVTRWGGALPQYTVGHLDRVRRIRAAVAAQPGLAVCGAAYDGVGVPACVATARQAVSQVIASLAARP